MIVLLEEPEAWSLMMLISAIAIDNADLSPEAAESIRRWRTDRKEGTPALEKLTEEMNKAMNAHLDSKFLRRVKDRGRYETVKK